MAVTKEKVQDTLNIIAPEDMAVVYDCLNGKDHSCIKNGKIEMEQIKCALNKAFSTNGASIAKRLSKLKMAHIEEYIQRAKTIGYIKKRLDIDVPFEEVQGFNAGAKVKIAKDSTYYGQNRNVGFLLESFSSKDPEEVQFVTFLDGYINTYHKRDIELATPQHKNNKQKDIVQEIDSRNREVFIEQVVDYVYAEIQRNPTLKEKFNTIDQFDIGDDIVMTEEANNAYKFSKEGSRGKILKEIGGGDFCVQFSYLSNSHEVDKQYEVHKDYMRHDRKIGEKDITREQLRSFISYKVAEDLDLEEAMNPYFKEIATDKLIENGVLLPIDDNNKSYALNFSEISRFIAPQLDSIYSNPELYSSSVMFEPPAERLPNVLRLQLTDGCDHNKCTFCGGFNGVSHMQKSKEQFIEHTDRVVEALGDYKREINRVFLGSGNGLEVNQDTLEEGLEHISDKLNFIKRVAIYGTTKSILKKTPEELYELRRRGLGCIYRGAESGSDQVLKYVRKGCSYEDMIKAGEIVNESRIDLSTMIMPGLGGIRFYQEHIDGTIKLLNAIDWKYVTFMGINPAENSIYERVMAKEEEKGTNRPLTDVELVKQVQEIINGLKTNSKKKIGMYGPEIDAVGKNPIVFNTVFDGDGKQKILKICKDYLSTHKDTKLPRVVSHKKENDQKIDEEISEILNENSQIAPKKDSTLHKIKNIFKRS